MIEFYTNRKERDIRMLQDTHCTSSDVLHSPVHSVTLAYAGLQFVVEVPESAVEGLLQEFGYFIQAGRSETWDFQIKIQHRPDLQKITHAPVDFAPMAISAMGIDGREPTTLHIQRFEDGSFQFRNVYTEGSFDGQQTVDAISYHPNPVLSVQAILTNVMSDLLLKHDRFFLHASGILHRDKAFLFSGKSGDGKTTVVWQSDGRTILSDELVCLSAEEDGSFIAHGTPYYGSWGRIGDDARAPLHCIHFLAKTPYNRIDALTPKDAFKRACQVVCFLAPSPEQSRKLLGYASRLVPYARLLSFKPTPELWSFLSDPSLFEKGLSHDFL